MDNRVQPTLNIQFDHTNGDQGIMISEKEKMAEIEGEASNSLFNILEEWNSVLKAENVNFDDLPKEPTIENQRTVSRRHRPTP